MNELKPKYPIYIISKGRWESRLTVKALIKCNVDFRIVIEPQEYEQYSSVIDKNNIIVLPFSNLGQGSIPARNFVWEHSIKEGHKRHWILDDNIKAFRALRGTKRELVNDGSNFYYIEKFVDKYKNIAMAGMQYTMFAVSQNEYNGKSLKPFLPNTRIYSCILLNNILNHRWRGRYNEDTDLSLRLLKDGWCTILFYAFLCDKARTMTMKGGNTESLYKLNGVDGRWLMAESLRLQHPDVVHISRKWGRWQHNVNYKPFKKNKLVKIDE